MFVQQGRYEASIQSGGIELAENDLLSQVVRFAPNRARPPQVVLTRRRFVGAYAVARIACTNESAGQLRLDAAGTVLEVCFSLLR